MRIHTATSTGPELRKVYEAGSDGSIRLEAEEGFQRWNEFDTSHRDFDTLEQLRDVLEEMSHDPKTTIVLGAPLEARQGHSADEYNDYTYSLFFADVDSFDFDGTAEEAITELFPFLDGKEHVYYFSPSSGIKAGWRLRVIWRIRLTIEEQSEYAAFLNEQISLRKGLFRKWIDVSIYKRGGFIFTARPDLRGIDDPHPVRTFYVAGDSTPEKFELPDEMVVVDGGARRRGKPTLHWDGEGGRHNAVFDFMRQYRDAHGRDASPDAESKEWIKVWVALSSEYDRLTVPHNDRRLFGEDYVRRRYKRIKGSRRTTRALKQQYDPMPLDRAQDTLADAMRRAIGERDVPRLTAIRITAGGGKSTAALRQLGIEKRYMEEKVGFPFTADYYVPTHKLGDELALKAREQDLEAVVEKGRSQEVNGKPVCFKHEAAKELNGIVLDVSAALCGGDDERCIAYDNCMWRSIKETSKTCDLRIRPHEFLTLQAAGENNENRRRVDVIVIDEDPISSLIKNGSVEIKELCDVTRHSMSDWLLRFYQVIDDGLTLERLEAAGFDEDVCDELIKAESELAPQVDVMPDMDEVESLRTAQAYDRHWWKYESVWRRLRDCIRSRSMNRIRVSRDKKKLLTNWASVVNAIPIDDDGRVKVQTVLMSATMDRSMVEQFFHVDDWIEIDVQKHPKSVVRQANASGSKAALLYGTGDREEEYGETRADKKAAAEKFRADVARIVGKNNLFTFKGVAELGDDVTGWFNGVEGIDEWRGQDAFILGRPLPPPYAVEDIARAIWQDGDDVPSVRPWYPKKKIAYVGECGMAWTERHPDLRVETVRWSICEGAILQAVARTRYVREPAKITILNGTPLPLEVDEVIQFEDLLPEELAYKIAPIRTSTWSLAPRLFKKFAEAKARSTFQYHVEQELYSWVVENRAEFKEVRFTGQKQWSRVYVSGWEGWEALARLGEFETREPKLTKKDNEERFAALMEQNRLLVEPDAVDALREAFEREPWFDEDGVQVAGDVLLDDGDVVDIGQLAQRARHVWPWKI